MPTAVTLLARSTIGTSNQTVIPPLKYSLQKTEKHSPQSGSNHPTKMMVALQCLNSKKAKNWWIVKFIVFHKKAESYWKSERTNYGHGQPLHHRLQSPSAWLQRVAAAPASVTELCLHTCSSTVSLQIFNFFSCIPPCHYVHCILWANKSIKSETMN